MYTIKEYSDSVHACSLQNIKSQPTVGVALGDYKKLPRIIQYLRGPCEHP